MARSGGDGLGLDWWLEDAERWELLRFEAVHDEEGLPSDACRRERRDVLEALVAVPGPVDHDFARFLLEQEILLHRHAWGFSRWLEIAALLVAEHGRPEDVWLLWRAIGTSFDTWCGLPHRLLLSAGGTGSTVAHVAASGREERDGLLEHLGEMDEMTGEEAAAFVAERRRYYADGPLRPGEDE
ncbi:hypothetical protein DZF91_37580 [Actinomadura logoneensis]|uniref:DUF4240 domain-containing protein n=1 Tax=Actinomadura logoneensis TaxID=2293572 RepID=A0A372J9R0_9ACTN|nr:hypothetical protein [Actinomadura logoneensis]RFU36546.1 hypothetical protein DZF91_37580 [Actinomadura logoneensis]